MDDGEVALWDVPTAACMRREPAEPGRDRSRSAGRRSRYDALLEAYEKETVSVPSWFTPSARSGSLEITLEPGSAFNAEVGVPAAIAPPPGGDATR